VSWLAASLVVLGLALVAGFAWYERSHPTARVLALVATLAALAALGRIAFAPIPNVKPTTDIVLLAGYALGGAPGFAVGAVAALASNVFFGQGPWTPWQMCAWGGVGIGGAVLARLAGRELGRTGLAVACAVAGAAYGVVMNLHLWVTFSGDHSLAKLGAYFATSLPFDVAHVIGNDLFCLLFGPALVRALTRYRQRFEVTWRPAPALAASVLAALVLVAAAPRAAEAATPLQWLQSAQNRDGGFGGDAGQRSTGLYTSWAGLGLAAAGRNPRDVRHGGRDVIAYARAHPPSRGADIGDTTRTILLLRAAGVSARIGRRDLVKEMLARRRPSGAFANRVNTTAFAIFALRAAGRSRSDRAVRSGARWIARQANEDGGFNFATKGGGSGIDDTGAALQALVAAGRRGTPTVRRAARFLARRQNPDGGYPLQPGGPSNAQSTAWAVQGLVAAGRDPDRQRRNGARSPIAYLRSLVTPSGKVRYSRTSAQTPVWVTAQALAALARKPFPLAPVPRAKRAAPAAEAPPSASAKGPASRGGATTASSSGEGAPSGGANAAAATASGGAEAPLSAPAGTAAPADLGPPTPPDLAPTLQSTARAAGYLTGALVAPIA
jgi:energy-coupling factor transport system substrate-specific component